MLGHLGRERSADAVRDALITAFADMPAPLRATLTWDQGTKVSEHRSFANATGVQVYFADPGSPWQRGSNENSNGLLRQYVPLGHRPGPPRQGRAPSCRGRTQQPPAKVPRLGHPSRTNACPNEHHVDHTVATIGRFQAREGKVYCCVVLDTYSRRVVG